MLEGVVEALASLPADKRTAALEGLDLSAFEAVASGRAESLVEALTAKNAQLQSRVHQLELDLAESRGEGSRVELDPARLAQSLFLRIQGKGRANPLRPALFVLPANGPGLVSTASDPEFRPMSHEELAAHLWWMDRCQPGAPVKIHDAGGAKAPWPDSREPASSIYAFELPIPGGKGFLLVTGKRTRALDEASIQSLAASLGKFATDLHLALRATPGEGLGGRDSGPVGRGDAAGPPSRSSAAALAAWQAAGVVLQARDFAGILEAICAQGCEIARAKGAALYTLSPFNEQLSLARTWGLRPFNVNPTGVLGRGLLGEAVSRRAALTLTRTGKGATSEVEGVSDAIAVPLLGADTPVGGLVLADPDGGGSTFEAADVRRAGELAEPFGLVLAHALSVQGLREKLEVDETTGLHNRQFLDTRIAELVASAKASQYRESFALLLVKLNRLLDYAADEDAYRTTGVLTMLATLLKERVPRGGLVARHGASTFAIILPGARKTDAADVAMSVLNAISALPVSPASGAQATAAAAVGIYPLDSIDLNAFLELLDQALVRAATTGVSTLKFARD